VTLVYTADQVSWAKIVQFIQFNTDQDGFINDTKLKPTFVEVHLHKDKVYHAYISLQRVKN